VDASGRARQWWLAWVDRRGVVTRIVEIHRGQPRLSPDGTRAAMGGRRIVVYDFATGISQQLTSEDDGFAHFPVWSLDGERVFYAARFTDRGRPDEIYSIAGDFSGAAGLVFESEVYAVPYALSPSGELVFGTTSKGDGNLWVLPADGGEPRLVVGGEANEQGADISPDGRWLAYSSNRSGTEEVYVEPFPDGGPRVQASADGGSEPRWSPVGNELFYRDGPRMIAVPITLQPSFAITGQRQELFDNDAFERAPWHVNYDVDHDGQRFLMVETAPRDEEQAGADRRINLMVNVSTELERLAPTR
jgi:Tol biopolymer transport system component